MKVSLTEDEARELLVAIRMTSAAHTALVSMSPSREVRTMLIGAVTRLASAERKLSS